MNPRLSIWYATDSLAEKYPNISAYVFCINNPLMIFDPNGKEIVESLDPNDMRNTIAHKAATHYRDDDAINIFAHGGEDSFTAYDSNNGKYRIRTVGEFKSFLKANSKKWNERKNNESITIVLHSCNTGKGKNSFAQKMSKQMKNVTIIAPNEELGITTNYNEIVRDKESGKIGMWMTFKNGKVVDSENGSTHPNLSRAQRIFNSIYDFFNKLLR
jgi:hypothetical protein